MNGRHRFGIRHYSTNGSLALDPDRIPEFNSKFDSLPFQAIRLSLLILAR